MKKIPISEIFYSIQGEGRYTGRPMLFIRTFGCNFTCSGFTSATGEVTGCDTKYAWSKEGLKDTLKYDLLGLWKACTNMLPNKSWYSESGLPVILCFTGGEPMLHQKFLIEFLRSITEGGLPGPETILFETNCSIPMLDEFYLELKEWLDQDSDRSLVWSNSPKLSNSGEKQELAIRPEIYTNQNFGMCEIDSYLKFVTLGTEEELYEINEVVARYGAYPHDVYLMPAGETFLQQTESIKQVAEACLKYGYTLSARVHTWIWDNSKGT